MCSSQEEHTTCPEAASFLEESSFPEAASFLEDSFRGEPFPAVAVEEVLECTCQEEIPAEAETNAERFREDRAFPEAPFLEERLVLEEDASQLFDREEEVAVEVVVVVAAAVGPT